MTVPAFIRVDVPNNNYTGDIKRFYINLDAIDYFTTDLVNSELKVRVYFRDQDETASKTFYGRPAQSFKQQFESYCRKNNAILSAAAGIAQDTEDDFPSP